MKKWFMALVLAALPLHKVMAQEEDPDAVNQARVTCGAVTTITSIYLRRARRLCRYITIRNQP